MYNNYYAVSTSSGQHYACKTLIGVHEMHGWMHPWPSLINGLPYEHPYPQCLVASNLSIKTLVARQWSTKWIAWIIQTFMSFIHTPTPSPHSQVLRTFSTIACDEKDPEWCYLYVYKPHACMPLSPFPGSTVHTQSGIVFLVNFHGLIFDLLSPLLESCTPGQDQR